MAGVAGVGDFILYRRGRRDELEGVRADVHVGELGLDLGHVAVHTLVARRARSVLRVGFDRRGVRAVGRTGSMALEARMTTELQELGVIGGAVHVMAGETRDAVRVHRALHEIVALHAILVGRAIGKMGKGVFTKIVFFQLPEIAQVLAWFVADGPIVIGSVDGLHLQGLALGVALDAGVDGGDGIEARGVDDVAAVRAR